MGFLGTNSTFSADFNLVAHLAMGMALLGGMLLARRRHYRAHKYCQSTVLLLNLPLIAFIMVPSFRDQVQPQLPGSLGDRFYAVATVHAVIGVIAQVLGLYILLVAGTRLLPRRLRFRRYKPWMRTELVLWWIVVLAGVAVYAVWYILPAAGSTVGAHSRNRLTVTLVNFQFQPKTLTIPAGTTVEWVTAQGVHTVDSDQGLFKSSILSSGGSFRHTFNRPGIFPYHCDVPGSPGGIGMAGRIIVRPQGREYSR
jgi:plastocyanin